MRGTRIDLSEYSFEITWKRNYLKATSMTKILIADDEQNILTLLEIMPKDLDAEIGHRK